MLRAMATAARRRLCWWLCWWLLATATALSSSACATGPLKVSPTRCVAACEVHATYLYRGTIPVARAEWSLGRCTSTRAATLSQTRTPDLGHAFHASCVLGAGIWTPTLTLYSETGARILRETSPVPIIIGVTE